VSLTPEKIAASAPDQAALTAASKLLKPALWPLLVARNGLVWGECQGSGSSPYRVVADESDLGAKCTCPSRKFPCKHSLALLWLRAEGKATFADVEPPDWVSQWLGRRRGGKPGSGTTPESAATAASLDAIPVEAPAPADPKSEARAAAQRERTRKDREAAILNGLDELDRWITDQLDRGLAAFAPVATTQCRLAAQRMVDAKAGGIANLIDRIPAEMFKLPEAERPDYLIERLGALHLLAEAYRRQELLSDGLRADVRQLVGWTMAKDDLLNDAKAKTKSGRWLVVATRAEVQPDKLRRLETWLLSLDGGEPLFAVLIDFVPISGAGSTLRRIGELIDADLVFYPSAVPLRAIIHHQRSVPDAGGGEIPSGVTLSANLARYAAALAIHPWLDDWPLLVTNAKVVRSGDALWLTDMRADIGLPIQPALTVPAMPLVGLEGMEICAVWDGRTASISCARTPLGQWQIE